MLGTLRACRGQPRGVERLGPAPRRLVLHVAQAALERAQHDKKLAQLLAAIALEQTLLNGADPLHHRLEGTPAIGRQFKHDFSPVAVMKASLEKIFADKAAHGARYGGFVDRRPARDLDRFDRPPNRDRGEHPPFMGIEAEMIRIDRADGPAQQELDHADPVGQDFVEGFRTRHRFSFPSYNKMQWAHGYFNRPDRRSGCREHNCHHHRIVTIYIVHRGDLSAVLIPEGFRPPSPVEGGSYKRPCGEPTRRAKGGIERCFRPVCFAANGGWWPRRWWRLPSTPASCRALRSPSSSCRSPRISVSRARNFLERRWSARSFFSSSPCRFLARRLTATACASCIC